VACALVRTALVIVAVLAGAWLVLGVRAQDLQSEATAPSPDVGRSLDSLRSARLLSVDKEPLMDEGLVLFASGRREEGLAIAERVVAEEPDNVDAWFALYTLYLASRDPKLTAHAARRVQALNPLIGDRLEEARR